MVRWKEICYGEAQECDVYLTKRGKAPKESDLTQVIGDEHRNEESDGIFFLLIISLSLF